ncbi:MAG: CPBP family intramembrane glutamic endopeptidase [Hornefia sp.]|nr:CPBP family intramembrane glutamic endopeptidase [Hornefia sp.]
MSLFIEKIIISVVQIALFAAIPLIWWMISERKECSFLEWIGIKKIKDDGESKTFIWIFAATICFWVLSIFILQSLKDSEMATSAFSGMGMSAIPAVLIYAVFNTALSEELLFRGFLLKRSMDKFGFSAGNLIQSILFGLMHGVMFFTAVGSFKAVLITVFTGGMGWIMGYINEKKAGGSILPSWGSHALANIFSGVCSAFLIFS